MQRLLLASSCAVFCLFSCSDVAHEPPAPALNQLRSALIGPDGGFVDAGPFCAVPVNPEQELMIRNLGVVNDPQRTQWTGGLANPSDGAWAFGRLMTAMAGPNDAPTFVRSWLTAWESNQSLNGFNAPARSLMKSLVTDPWLANSGGVRLDLTRAPFRLLAIVNRMDLGDLPNGSAGEGRFVFGVLDPAGNPLQFTVILEYRLPATTQGDVDRWVTDWHNLASHPLGSPAFNQALEVVTNRFAGPNAASGRINGSAINQVRTNEIALAPIWELREFTLGPTGQLVQSTVSQTPDLSLNSSPSLANFVNTNQAALLAGAHVVPLTFNGVPFRAAAALTPPNLFWNAPGIVNNDARFMFSVNTCNGCHAGETGTAFLHVSPRPAFASSSLSGFLTGRTQPDPVSGAPRTFNDLARRASAFSAQICAAAPPPASEGVVITSPANGATVSGLVTLTATVSGPLSRLQFLLDGAPVGPPLFSAPFSFPWDSTTAPVGSHTLSAVAFDLNNVPTFSAPRTLNIAPSNGPDFVVTDVKGPASVLPGSQFTAAVTVCNRGNTFGGAVVDLVLSSDTTVSVTSGDRLVGGGFFSLFPGECRVANLQGFATPNGPGLTWFLGAIADLPNMITELNETNNTHSGAQMGIGFAPDFVITDVVGPASVLPGSQFSAQVTVCNQGNAFGSGELNLVLSSDAVIEFGSPSPTADRLVGFASVALNPGQCILQPMQGSATPPGPNGSWFLGAIIDRSNVVLEFNETNNTKAGRQVGIGFGPDFTVSSVSGPATAMPGSTFATQVTVCNQGTGFGSTRVDLVLSADAVISLPTDRLVGGSQLSLSPGACSVLSVQTFATPPGPEGLYFLGAVVDLQNAAIELNESNNTNPGKQLAIGFGPDFTITTVRGPPSLPLGSSFLAQVTVCNRGNSSGGTPVDVVLSSDATIALSPDPAPPSADRLIGGTVVFLVAGQCQTLSINAFGNPPGGPGTYFLGAIADRNRATPDLNRENNVATGTQISFTF